MSIATKTGDDGTTGLMYGRRVPKSDPCIAACGAVDELNAALGLARSAITDAFVAQPLLAIQKELVALMGELAVVEEDKVRYAAAGFAPLTGEMVERVTALIDDLEQNRGINLKHWATPGDNPVSAAFDFARTVCRRAERDVVELAHTGMAINPETLRYLNRVSDLLWLYARYIEKVMDDPASPRSGKSTLRAP